MSQLHEFIGSLAKLAGADHADRIDRQNVLVFHDELKGGTVFDRKGNERDRSWVLFRGFPETAKVHHLKGLVRLLELSHYIAEGKASDDEIAEAYALTDRLSVTEAAYPDVAALMPVSGVAKTAINWV